MAAYVLSFRDMVPSSAVTFARVVTAGAEKNVEGPRVCDVTGCNEESYVRTKPQVLA